MKRQEILEKLGITAATFKYYEHRKDIVAISGNGNNNNKEYDIDEVKAIVDKWRTDLESEQSRNNVTAKFELLKTLEKEKEVENKAMWERSIKN